MVTKALLKFGLRVFAAHGYPAGDQFDFTHAGYAYFFTMNDINYTLFRIGSFWGYFNPE